MAYREDGAAAGVLVTAVGRHVAGTSVDDGKLLWKHAVGSAKEEASLRIALHEDRVVAGRVNELVCIHQRTGEIVWKAECPIAVGTLVATASRIFVACGGELACLDVHGKLIWHELAFGHSGAATLAVDGVVTSSEEPD